jgi:hypothetical protein
MNSDVGGVVGLRAEIELTTVGEGARAARLAMTVANKVPSTVSGPRVDFGEISAGDPSLHVGDEHGYPGGSSWAISVSMYKHAG